MVLLAFIGGLMVGGTIGVLVAALCFAAWRSDSAAADTGERLGAARAAGLVDTAAAPGMAAPGMAASRPLADMPLAEAPLADEQLLHAAGYAARPSGGTGSTSGSGRS